MFDIDGLIKNSTIIESKKYLSFTIIFHYKETNITNNILKSIINFRFKEKPIIELNTENQILSLNNTYPNYTPQEYRIKVSNYDELKINNVPLNYNFEIEIDKPLTAKVYTLDGTEISNDLSLIGNNIDKIEDEYILKVFWDNSNPEESLEYNNLEYQNKTFNCKLYLKAVPIDAEYQELNITKQFEINITSAPYYFSTNIEMNNIELDINTAETTLDLINYISNTQYNNFDLKYKISLTNNEKYKLTTIDSNDGTLSLGYNKNTITLTFNSLESAELNYIETLNVKVEITTPYKDEKNLFINIINSEELIGQNIEYDVSYTDMYSKYDFTSSDGWRILDPGTLNSDGTYSNTKIVTTGIPVKLYYNASSGPTSTSNQSSKWWGTYEQVNKEYGLNFSSWTSGNSRYFAAYGMKYNFKLIPFSSGTNSTKNKGYYTKITNASATSTTTGEIFINDNSKSVHALLKEEMNLAINKMQRNNDRVLTELDTLSATVDPRGMFYLRGLNNYDYTSTTTAPYWLGTPNDDSTGLVRVQATGTFSGGTDNTYGVRPVITLNKKIQLNNGVWQIVE